ncbi:MAG TPA: RNA chaperone Hfq [Blastocatellia bacterium]|nr:RNA chaperone Hfq [Blastocatellia bacterium]
MTIYLMSGVKLTGRIKSFDKYSVILEAGSQEQLIFKHAISTVSLPRGGGRDYYQSRPSYGERGERPERTEREHHTEREPHAEQATGTQANTAGGQEKS